MERENIEKNELAKVVRKVRKTTYAKMLKNEGGGASIYYTMDKDAPLREYEHYETYPTVAQANEVMLTFTMLKEQDRWRENGEKKKG
jgi:predicted AAA+ superfamily ATPase